MGELHMVETLIVKGIEQVPALVMLGLLVYYLSNSFLRAMAHRDEVFIGFQKEINDDLKDISNAIHTQSQLLRDTQVGSCNFHESFTQQLERIEKHIKGDKRGSD